MVMDMEISIGFEGDHCPKSNYGTITMTDMVVLTLTKTVTVTLETNDLKIQPSMKIVMVMDTGIIQVELIMICFQMMQIILSPKIQIQMVMAMEIILFQ